MKTNMPGCFGSVMAYSNCDDVCQKCNFGEDCDEESYQLLTLLRKEMNLDDVASKRNMARVKSDKSISSLELTEAKVGEKKPRANRELTVDDIDIVNAIKQVKAADRAKKLLQRGIDSLYMVRMMALEQNPFKSEPPRFLYVACNLLMNDGFTKPELTAAFIDDEGTSMAKKTASSHVAIAVAVLVGMSVAVESDGVYRLNLIANVEE